MNRTVIGALFGLTLSAAWAQNAMPVLELNAGFHRIEAEVAASDQNRQVGLMNRQAMPQQRGMLFVFTQPNTHCMWMRNTLIPLSVAFIDDEGYIINIEDMQPQTDDPHWSKGAASYALEMKKGWFAERGIVAGAPVKGLPAAGGTR